MEERVKHDKQWVNNSTSFQYDNDLHFHVARGEVWSFEAFILFSSGPTADLLVTFQLPAGGQYYSWVTAPDASNPAVLGMTLPLRAGAATGITAQGTGTVNFLHITGVVDLYSTTPEGDSDFNFMFAQAVAEPVNTTIYAGSYLRGTRLIP